LTGLAGIQDAGPGDLTFVANKKYLPYLKTTNASAVIAASGTTSDRLTLLLHPEPYFAFMQAVRIFYPARRYAPGTHPTAVIAESARIDATAHVGPNVVIEDHCTVGKNTAILANDFIGESSEIGDDCLLYPNVTVREKTLIGNRVIVHSGTVIGSDGFGYATSGGVHHKIYQVGRVVIDDDVEIGANVTIDRGTLGDTHIGEGSKIDNLVQIAHNVKMGKGCILVSQVGVSGSTKLGDYVVAAGQVGIVGHIDIGDGVQIAAQSGVARGIEAGTTVFGSPAREKIRAMKIEACVGKLPEYVKQLRELERKVSAISDDDQKS